MVKAKFSKICIVGTKANSIASYNCKYLAFNCHHRKLVNLRWHSLAQQNDKAKYYKSLQHLTSIKFQIKWLDIKVYHLLQAPKRPLIKIAPFYVYFIIVQQHLVFSSLLSIKICLEITWHKHKIGQNLGSTSCQDYKSWKYRDETIL